jgi:hypothetical protein
MQAIYSRKLASLFAGIFVALFLPSLSLAADNQNPANPANNDWVKGHVLINAPASVVWYSVHEERKADPDIAYSKILEQNNNELTLEQRFVLIPMLDSSTCVMKNTEIPMQRIDYHLLKSDHLKAMEGSWVLTPSLDGKSTLLELSTHIDTGLPIPHFFVNNAIAKKVERRLHHVKAMAEKIHPDLAYKVDLH